MQHTIPNTFGALSVPLPRRDRPAGRTTGALTSRHRRQTNQQRVDATSREHCWHLRLATSRHLSPPNHDNAEQSVSTRLASPRDAPSRPIIGIRARCTKPSIQPRLKSSRKCTLNKSAKSRIRKASGLSRVNIPHEGSQKQSYNEKDESGEMLLPWTPRRAVDNGRTSPELTRLCER